MLDVRRLSVLREVAAWGSLSAAAQALSFSQPAVSHQIAKLEEETGAKLLDRGARGVTLTEAGVLLVRHAEAVLAQLGLAENELAELMAVRSGHLRLAAFPSAFVHLVSHSLTRFREEHPGVDVSLRQLGLEEATGQLDAGELDLAVTFEYDLVPSATERGVGRRHLLDDPMYLVLSSDHPLAHRPELKLADLAEESWIQFTQGPASKVLYRAFRQAGYEPRIALETDDLLAIQGLVAARAGATLIPGMALPAVRSDLTVRSLGADLPNRRVYALWPESHRSPAAGAMLDLLAAEAGRLQGQLRSVLESAARDVA